MVDSKLVFARRLWLDGLSELWRRGDGKHEAGAFLLGQDVDGVRTVSRWIFYDELQSDAYSTGVCILEADAFDRLWHICRTNQLNVVGDAHTHPGSARQSQSDRANPMVALAGHIALIVPDFARGPHWRHRLGIYRYEGSHQWTDFSGWRARKVLSTGTLR
ncbi:MAG: hypothetical protein BGO82_05565 [Devosia sp. 67-54]|uniref:Mov34/MPN/PAD-1 family protein n=1 Tax=unclassified Devosia TaxID=196773 RepID=UPI00095E4A4A|nr:MULTISPECIES: Mov34/MPN/PAD-1 family protein [unclassified Devosia]MBN9306917.1 Mov34/MPN/PAD-1 family protein [Devosia sp.]OJX16987.1 MAG: hypothetical protein BGO82_05565 [Devosia sp. 67-54]